MMNNFAVLGRPTREKIKVHEAKLKRMAPLKLEKGVSISLNLYIQDFWASF